MSAFGGTIRLFRRVRRVGHLAGRIGAVAAKEEVSVKDVLGIARGAASLGVFVAPEIALPALLLLYLAESVVPGFIPSPTPDEKRKAHLIALYGPSRGEAKWQTEFINRQIEINLAGKQA